MTSKSKEENNFLFNTDQDDLERRNVMFKSVASQCGHFLNADEENIVVMIKSASPVRDLEEEDERQEESTENEDESVQVLKQSRSIDIFYKRCILINMTSKSKEENNFLFNTDQDDLERRNVMFKSVASQCGHFLNADEENIVVMIKSASPVRDLEEEDERQEESTENEDESVQWKMQHHPGSWYLPWGVPLQKMVAVPIHAAGHLPLQPPTLHMQPMLTGLPAPLATLRTFVAQPAMRQQPQRKICGTEKDKNKLNGTEKRKADDGEPNKDLKKAKLETKALKAKRPGFTDDRYNETSYYIENGLRKVYPYYFTFTTFTKGRWVGERILDVFAREFRAHPAEEYERCIRAGTLTVNYDKVPTDYRLKHNDLLANVVHRHEVPVTSQAITIVHMDEDIVVVNKPASIPVHPCGRYRHNTVVFILAKEYNLKNLRTIHRLDRLTSGLLLFGRSPKKARQMEHQIRNRLVSKEYVCRVEGEFPDGMVECKEPIEVVSYKIGVCKVSPKGKECNTFFQKLGYNGKTSIVLCRPKTGRMHQIRVHLQYLGYPVVNDPLYNHDVFGPLKGKSGDLGGKTDEELVRDLIHIHNAENWLGMDGDSELSMFNSRKADLDDSLVGPLVPKSDEDADPVSREPSPCDEPCDSRSSPPTCESTPNPLTLSSFASRSGANDAKVTVATQTGHEAPDFSFNPDKMTVDQHCYECKVRYRDPKPQDLVMYLHAWKYKGPGWEFETELPEWAKIDWVEPDISE